MVYEGMRSMAGPFLGTLGASALTVGIITGAGEAIALVLRMVSGPVADRSGRYWSLTFWGYALTAICVPLLRSEEHTSELQSLMRISYAVFCLKKKKYAYISTNF